MFPDGGLDYRMEGNVQLFCFLFNIFPSDNKDRESNMKTEEIQMKGNIICAPGKIPRTMQGEDKLYLETILVVSLTTVLRFYF